MIAMLPKITVVTPSYNQGRFIEQTIRSIIDQEYPHLEYFIYDGGSTDETVGIIKKYQEHIDFWVSSKDNGQADAIMQGFRRATGEIICWVNSDDILLPGSLFAVAKYFAAHPEEECLVGASIIIDEHGVPVYHRKLIPSFSVGAGVTYSKLLYYGCSFNQPSAFFRRSAFFNAGGFDTDLRFSFDYDLFLRLSKKRRFASTVQFLSAFRIHEKSKSTTIQDVCRNENRILWERNGREVSATVTSSVRRLYYALENYVFKYSMIIRHYKVYRSAVRVLHTEGTHAKK